MQNEERPVYKARTITARQSNLPEEPIRRSRSVRDRMFPESQSKQYAWKVMKRKRHWEVTDIDPTGLYRVWDNYKLLGIVPKNKYSKIVITITARDGVKYLCMREHVLSKRYKAWVPTRKGMTIPWRYPSPVLDYMQRPTGEVEIQHMLEGVILLLNKSLQELEKFDIYNEKNVIFGVENKKK